MPLGGVQITVQRGETSAPIPLNRVNQIEEGDRIAYAPALRPKEKRQGEVAVVLVSSLPRPDEEVNFIVLETRDAGKPAEWTAPFRASLAVYVYGPAGLSTRKLKGFLAKDQELISQLAEYAEKTAQTEAVLQALTVYEDSGGGEQLGAALQGFAHHYGVNSKIDRNAPLNEQTLAAFRTLNPALSAYDPISPSASERVSQTASLAATVAGMFLGSTVGLAAGSTAMALNLKTLVFPDTEFRSAYSQPAKADTAVPLCATREPRRSRKQLGYLWALRLPDTRAPQIAIEKPDTVAPGMKMSVRANVSDWKLAPRIREWALKSETGATIPVPAVAIADQRSIELHVPPSAEPGRYTLAGLWDWDTVQAGGAVHVTRMETFESAKVMPESQNRLRQRSGKQVITLEGADFQFVEKVLLVKDGDRYASPAQVPFTLPAGLRRGPQPSMEMQVDTAGLTAGQYSLLLSQQDGVPHRVPVQIVEDPPRLTNLPVVVYEGEKEGRIILQGEGLERITELAAEGVTFTIQKPGVAVVRRMPDAPSDRRVDLRMSVKGYGQPLVLANALLLAGERPRIVEAKPSAPHLPIALLPNELPAGLQMGVLLRVVAPGEAPAVQLSCKGGSTIQVEAGAEKSGIKLQRMSGETLFVSFDPGNWPSGCTLYATLEAKPNGRSDRFELGKVTRLPKIESFKLTDEKAAEGMYFGMLTGTDLELVGKVGWTADAGYDVAGLPVAIAGEPGRQSLKVQVPWPSPAPHSPIFVWFRGEDTGRSTTVRY